jgi:hypothetical protein
LLGDEGAPDAVREQPLGGDADDHEREQAGHEEPHSEGGHVLDHRLAALKLERHRLDLAAYVSIP